MTSKEILLNTIRLQNAPRIPVITLSSGVWTCNQHGMSLQDSFEIAPQKAAGYVLNTNKLINTDLIWTAADCNNLALRGLGAKTTFNLPGIAASIEEPLIHSAEEVDHLDVNQIENDRGFNSLLETTRILFREAGSDKMIGVSQWGPMTMAGLLIGMEHFMTLTIRDRPAAKHIMEFAAKLTEKYWNLFVQAGAQLVSLAEPSASCDMISPKLFSDMALPFLKLTSEAMTGLVESKFLHICGNTTKILERLPETGFDVFSLDYKVDLSIAREKLGGKMCFAGQLDPVSVMLMSSPQQIEKKTKECIEKAGAGGYIVMPGCDLPPAVSVENVQAMVNTVLNYR